MVTRIPSWESLGKEPSVQRHSQKSSAYESNILSVFGKQENIHVVKPWQVEQREKDYSSLS